MQVIICERDTSDVFQSTGPIIMERAMNKTDEEIKKKAQELANDGRYGRVWLAWVRLKDATEVLPEKPFVEIDANAFELVCEQISASMGSERKDIAEMLERGDLSNRLIPRIPF